MSPRLALATRQVPLGTAGSRQAAPRQSGQLRQLMAGCHQGQILETDRRQTPDAARGLVIGLPIALGMWVTIVGVFTLL